MRNLVVAITALITISVIACAQNTITGNKNYTTKKVDVKNEFTAITVNGSPDVYYTQTSGKPSVEIYGSSNIIPYVEVFVKGETLIVQYKRNTSINNPGKLEIRVSAPDVSTMTVHGSGDIYIEKGINTNKDLSFNVHGSGDIQGKNLKCNTLAASVHGSGDINFSGVSCSNIDANVHGSGDIVLNGKARNASYHVSGSGDITANGLQANNVEAYVNGSGDIRCFATDKLSGKVSGSGDVGYKGNPEIDFSRKGLHKL
ncbi:head GIN domain-containing protein [Bacteroides sp. 519]|uniref:head GIN domain-containing protein n=1 Tax=Bacteroides sp. 519 TaxID=2302937 RepID=UPI0013D46EAB|nr:head GIN domain-containing protein [Bacteroides sp. 519]NDV58099.1 DUF2807 domain-containing protein [Bacteroides sp. 519]